MSEDKRVRTRYRTANWSQYNAALKARNSLTLWLDLAMCGLAEPPAASLGAASCSRMQRSSSA